MRMIVRNACGSSESSWYPAWTRARSSRVYVEVGKSDTAVGEGGRMAWDRIEPCGTSMKHTVGAVGGGSAGGRRLVCDVAAGGMCGAGSGGGRQGSKPESVEQGIWSNRTHPVGPYPSQLESSSGGSDSGQQSQSIASARKSSVILLISQ